MKHDTKEASAMHAVALAPERQNTIDSTAMMMDASGMDRMIRFAELMASGRSTIPAHLRGNAGDCLAVTMQAMSWGMNPHAVAQKTHIVNGTLGYEAQLVAAAINASRVVSDRFKFEWFGPWEKIVGKFKEVESRTKKDDNGNAKKYIVPAWDQKDEHGLGVRVSATIRGESEPRALELLMTQARTRNSTLWTEDPKQQLAYLAQKRWARLYAPDVILGVYTPDEFEQSSATREMGPADVVSHWTPELLAAGKEAASKGAKAYGDFWKNTVSPDMRNKLVNTSEHASFKDIAVAADKARTVETPEPEAKKPAPAAEPTEKPASETSTGAPEVTYESLLERLNAATNEDAMYVVMDWANELGDKDQIKALEARFDERLEQMRGA